MVSAKTISKGLQPVECTINCLPRDLMEEIFFRLPVSSLLRCIEVCKQWYKLIRDPHFITSHLEQAPSCAILFFPQQLFSGKAYPSDAIVLDESWSQSAFAVPVIGPDDFLCGSCNGLLCLYTKTSKIKIANFATGECLHLDKPVKSSRGDHFSFYSFGFHPTTKEYKVAHFLCDRQKYSRGTSSVIQVYTLGTEKWKDVQAPEVLNLSCVKNSGVIIVDGTMYWLTEDTGASWKHAVIAFDLNKESFSRIQLPSAALGGSGRRRYWITEIDKKISIVTAQVYRDFPKKLNGELQIWTLDNRVEQQWVQKCSIQHAQDYIPGPHFVHKDKFMMQSHDCNLYLSDLLGKNCASKSSDMVRLFDFSPHNPESMQSYLCLKSLVRLDAYKKVGIWHSPKQQEGWQLKKWEAWEHQLCKAEDTWRNVYQLEQDLASLHGLGMKAKEALQHLPDEVIRQRLSMEIDQILQHLPDCPYQNPRSMRRVNLVEWKWDMESLSTRMDGLKDIVKVYKDMAMRLSS